MQPALKLHTTVLPGHRIEVLTPELPEGAQVDLIVMPTQTTRPAASRPYVSMLELAESLPHGPHPFATWEEYERFLQEEKDSWDR